MLDSKIITQIEEFVYEKPRSMQEIADLIKKNWRTADRYIDEIKENFGTISTRIFRGGTRGSLKIVYWSSIEKVSSSIFQERLEKDIFNSKKKEDFSSFDIFQYVSDKKKESFIFEKEIETIPEFKKNLLNSKKQVLFFSGNLSFINFKEIYEIFEKLIEKNIIIKILCRVDISGKENIEKILSLNLKSGKSLIEIRHDNNPIRGVIIDGELIRLKEEKLSTGKINELNKNKIIIYNIKEKSWVEWLTKIFWKKFSNSIDANKRIENLKKIYK